jgi:hypothetical protein
MGSPDNKITREIMKDGNEPYSRTTFTYGDINMFFYGSASNSDSAKDSTIPGTLDALGGMFGTLIIDIIALVFIWLAFMAAKNVSKAVSMAVQPFEEIGKKVGSLAASLPKYTPLPIPGGSMAGASKAVSL